VSVDGAARASSSPASGGGDRRAAGRRPIEEAVASKRRAQVVTGLRGLARPSAGGRAGRPRGPAGADARVQGGRDGEPSTLTDGAADEWCDLCSTTIPAEHRHLLNLVERRIECVCESCWALRSGDAEFRPVGARTVWLEEFELPDDVWASFQIPIGLAFFMESSIAGCVVALYPSPGGATESELHFSTWSRLVELNPVLSALEPDIEGLIVNRLADPPVYSIAPIDRCYALTGTVKANWEGISGGSKLEQAVSSFFDELHALAVGT
jgi:hypothetical protein